VLTIFFFHRYRSGMMCIRTHTHTHTHDRIRTCTHTHTHTQTHFHAHTLSVHLSLSFSPVFSPFHTQTLIDYRTAYTIISIHTEWQQHQTFLFSIFLHTYVYEHIHAYTYTFVLLRTEWQQHQTSLLSTHVRKYITKQYVCV